MNDMNECADTLRRMSDRIEGVGYILAALSKTECANEYSLRVVGRQLLEVEENIDAAVEFLRKQIEQTESQVSK